MLLLFLKAVDNNAFVPLFHLWKVLDSLNDKDLVQQLLDCFHFFTSHPYASSSRRMLAPYS